MKRKSRPNRHRRRAAAPVASRIERAGGAAWLIASTAGRVRIALRPEYGSGSGGGDVGGIPGGGAILDQRNRDEAGRQDGFAAERIEKQSLRAGLDELVQEEPPEKISPDADLELRDGIKQALITSGFRTAADEEDARDAELVKEVGAFIKQTHGVRPGEALARYALAEANLRVDPQGALQYLAQTYGDGSHAAAVKANEQRHAETATMKFFERFDVEPGIEPLMVKVLQSPDFRRSGNHERDLMNAYRAAKEKTNVRKL